MTKERIELENKFARRINEVMPWLLDRLRPLIGEKVRLGNGYRTDAFTKLSLVEDDFAMHIAVMRGLRAVFSTTFQSDGRIYDLSRSIPLGTISEDDCLESVADFTPLHCHWDYEHVKATKERIAELREKIRKLEDSLGPCIGN